MQIFLGLGSPIVVVALLALALVSRRVCRICRRLFRATVDTLPVSVLASDDSVFSESAADDDAGAATEVSTATAERFEETTATMILYYSY